MSERESDAETEASRWIARLEAEDVTLRDHKRFRRWLAADPGNRTAYEAVSRTWDNLDALKFVDGPLLPAPPQRSRRWLVLGGASAVAAAAVGAALLPSLQDAGATPYTTGVGQRRSVALSDGSHIHLDANSAVRVAFDTRQRRVHMLRGEALFDVKDDAARPFAVATPYGVVQTKVGAFSLKFGDGGVRTTVLSGQLESFGERGLVPALAPRGSPVRAGPNEEIVISDHHIAKTHVAPAIVARRLAWRDGMLAFDDESLSEAAQDVERQTGVRFEFAEQRLGELRVGGYIRADDSDAFMQLVESNLALHVERKSAALVRISA